MLKNSRLFKRIVSGMAAVVMAATNALSFVPMNISAENMTENTSGSSSESVAVNEETSSAVRNDPQTFEYSDDDVSVTAEINGDTVFSDGQDEVSAEDVILCADEIENADGFEISAGENEEIRYFDVGFEKNDGTAVSVDGVTATLDFSIASEAGDIEVYSLSDEGAVELPVINESSSGSGETVTVTDNKLRTYAVKYTVDFHYDGYEYNIYGGGSVLLSKIFEAFGIDEDVSASTVSFTDDTLLQIEKVTASDDDETASDWRLVSLKPFSSDEKLTVNLANGKVIEIGVTDDAVSTREISVLNLKITEGAEFVNLFEKAAESYKNDDGSYTLPADFEYTLPTDPRTEWKVSEYDKATLNADGTSYTVAAADIPALEAWVWTPDSSDEDHRIVYSLHLVTAGYNVINPGELEIRLPKSILPDGADSLELSLVTKEEFEQREATAKDSKNIRFVYEFDGDDIVFTNVKEIPSGFDGAIYIAYHTTKKTYDYQDMSISSDVKAFATIYDLYDENTGLQDKFLYDQNGNRSSSATTVDSEGKTHRTYTAYDKDGNLTGDAEPVTDMESDAEPVYINTGVEIKNVTKTLTQSNVYELWNTTLWGTEPDGPEIGEGKNGYVYFVWEIKSEIYTQENNPTKITQRYDFTLKEDTINQSVKILSETGAVDSENPDGTKTVSAENIMYKMAGEGWKPWAGSTEESRTVTSLTEKEGTVRRDYVITRIPRDELKTTIDSNGKKIGTAFQITNTATTTVSPKDDVDKDTEKTASEKYTYAPPVYTPPVAKFDTTKIGVYTPSEKTVYSSNQVSSFELESFKNEETKSDITGLRYHVTVNAEGLANTFQGNYTETESDVSGYKKLPVEYILTDNRLKLVDIETNETTDLSDDDYSMTAIDVSAEIKDGEYSQILRTFVSKAIEDQDDAVVTLRLYEKGSAGPVDVAKYDEATDTWTVLNSDYVTRRGSSFRGFTKFEFSAAKDIVGYELYSSNPYYGTYYKAYPTVTLRSTDAVRAAVGDAEKIQINNYADLTIKGHDPETGEEIVSTSERMGKVYAAEAIRDSVLTKKFISTDYNDIMNGEYLANWEIEFYETMQTGIDEFIPVVQGGGTFYDLLPIMSTARLDEIKVYPMYEGESDYEAEPLHEGGDYTVEYSYKTDKSGFKRVMLKVDISEPAVKYKLKIRTIHTHADILDYGRNIRNSVCYKTKNADIGGGRINDGGTIQDGNVFVNMQDEIGDTDKKKFMYSQATHYIPALISTVSEIQKTVSSETSPTASLSAIVSPNEEYEYHYRNMNTGSTYSKNLVIMDSIENYMTDAERKTWNGSQAFNKMRDWYGTPLHFNLQLLDRKGIDYKIYVTEQTVNLGKYNTDTAYDAEHIDPDRIINSTNDGYEQIANESTFAGEELTSTFVEDVLAAGDGWFEIKQTSDYVNNEFTFTKADGSSYDLSNIKGFMIDFGENVFMPNESVLFGLTMRAPSAVGDKADPTDTDKELKTYNNIYRYHDTSEDKDFKDPAYVEHTFTHQDKTDVIFHVSGDVRLRKVDASDNSKVIHNAVFVLEGTSAYGTAVRKELSTDANGNIIFRDIEKGEYTLREIDATSNYQITDPRTVTVDEYGIAAISGADDLYAFDITIQKKQNSSENAAPESGAQYVLTKGNTAGTAPAAVPVTVTDAANIQDGESVSVWTNSAGVAQFTNVPAGEYVLTHGSESYNIKVSDDGTGENVVVGEGETQGTSSYLKDTANAAEILLVRKEYGIEDEPRYHADLFFQKVLVDPSDNSETVLSGAEFTLTTIGNGSSDHKDKNQYDEEVTMTVVSSDIGLTFENLGIGKYILYESKAPEGAVPDNRKYYVWVQGDKNTTPNAKIYTGKNYTDPNHEDYHSELEMVDYTYVIKNTKTSEATLYKRDNVNLTEMLAGAQFDLYPYGVTTDGNTVEAKDEEELKAIVCDDGLNSDVWRSTSDWSMGTHVDTGLKVQYRVSDSEGLINLYELQPGVAYKLVETKAPKNHKAVSTTNPPTWDIRVTSEGVVRVFENGTEVSTKLGDSYVITNERTYDKDFTIIKSWVGGAPVDDSGNPTAFPVIKMSTQETEEIIKVATLNKTLFKTQFPSTATTFTRLDIATNRGDPVYTTVEDAWAAIVAIEGSAASNMETQFVRVDANALATPTDDWYKSGNTYNTPDGGTATVDFASEEGVVYMACINNHTYFWSDAKKIYLWKECVGAWNKGNGFASYNITGTLDFTYFYTDRVITTAGLFENNYYLEKLIIPNFNNCFNVTTMEYMFNNCNKLSSLILPDEMDCSNTTSFYKFLFNTYLLSTNFETSLITSNKLKNTKAMFKSYGEKQTSNSNLTISLGDSFDTSGVTEASNQGGTDGFLTNAKTLRKVSFGKKSTFENNTNFSAMFEHCIVLSEIDGLQYFNTSNATTMNYMFNNCNALVSLDLSSFDTSSLTKMQNMFSNCYVLNDLDLSSFDTSKVTTFQGMFSNCSSLTTLDLSSFTTDNNPSIRDTFDGCKSLVTIYANPYEWPMENYWQNQTNENYYGGTFRNCNVLTGGNGSKSIGSNYFNAIIDGVESTIKAYDGSTFKRSQGYFTDWSESPNYTYVYNKYMADHPELTNTSNTLNATRTVRALALTARNAVSTLAASSGDEESPFTAPEVVYLTGKTRLTDEAAQNILAGLGLGDTFDSSAYYVTETVSVDGNVVANLVAKWTINSNDQWECAMMVYDPDAECYVWEDTIPTGYTTDHDSSNKLFVEKDTGYADITNTKPGETPPEYGSLALSKLVYLNGQLIPDNMRADDEFTFTVTLTPPTGETVPNKARYGGIEFVKNAGGTALEGTVRITKTVQDTNEDGTEYGIVLSRIPVGWTYSIAENSKAEFTDKGDITEGDIETGTDPSTGTIASDIKDTDGNITQYGKRVTWKNDVDSADLVLMKNLERKEDDGSGNLTDKELSDTDKTTDYGFTVVLTGLYPNAGYSYTIGSDTTQFTADENGTQTLTLTLRHGSSVKFNDLPLGTVYSVSESIPSESGITYETTWSRYEGDDESYYTAFTAANADAQNTEMSDRLDKFEWVRFDNTKITQKTVDVNVEKFWFADWYGESGYETSVETALVTLQRNDGMYTVTPDDGTRTLDSSNSWKDTFADLPVMVGGRDVSYTLGEITVGGYKPGIISSEVGELVYGTVNTLTDADNRELAYFAYKIGYTFKIDEETYANKAVELCNTEDGKVYMFYDGDLYTVTKDGSDNIAVKYTGSNKRSEGKQNRFIKKTDPSVAADYCEVYESYVNSDSNKVYYVNEGDEAPLVIKQMIVKNSGTDILYIQHTDGIFYKAEKTTDGIKWKLGEAAFKWNTSDDAISDPEGNLKYVVTNVKIKTYSVSISKQVNGNLGNKARRFEFDVIAGSLNDEYPVVRTYEGETTNEKITFTSGVGSVEIGHGETVVISNLPEGTNVLIREREYNEYDVSSEDGYGNEGKSDKGGEITVVMDSNQTVTFTNTLVGEIPTGIELNVVTILMLGIVTGGFLYYTKKKQRQNSENEI